jgi:hypothetical protein
MLPILIKIGSATVAAKLERKFSRMQTGKPRTQRCRYPVVKKGKSRFKKLPKFIS